MPVILVSHRRNDSAAAAAAITDKLEPRFADISMFLDVDTIGSGKDKNCGESPMPVY